MIHPIEILIADDHEIFRFGLRRFLAAEADVSVTGEASDGQEAVRMAHRLVPDVILMDIVMPVMNGIQATGVVKSEMPDIEVIGLSMTHDKELITQLMKAGARGYLAKDVSGTEVIQAIKTVYRGEIFFSQKVVPYQQAVMEQARIQLAQEKTKLNLSGKEIKVLKYICKEYSTKEIAGKMGLSRKTIDWYRKQLMEKTGSKSSAGLIVFAIQNNLFR